MIKRNTNSIFPQIFLFCLAMFLLFPTPVYAYIDPGTGSYVLQLFIGFVFGGLFAVKLFWGRIKNIFFRRSKHQEGDRKTD